ncbi:MAG: hypothetical protein ABIS08_10150 [Pseudolysinimonas sp.]
MLVPIVIVGFVLLVAAGLVVAGLRARRGTGSRGSGSVASGVLGGLDLAFNPMGAEARNELDVEQRHVVPAPSPDGDKGISDGRIRIDL